jgi:hypothetical protein
LGADVDNIDLFINELNFDDPKQIMGNIDKYAENMDKRWIFTGGGVGDLLVFNCPECGELSHFTICNVEEFYNMNKVCRHCNKRPLPPERKQKLQEA